MKEGEQKTIKEVVGEAIGIRGFSVERLSSLTDVPERYLKAILNEEPEQLPALPYVRGYLI
ncbi:MAG: helix-turn-helix domain-containing protein, partial [Patescibacteria group bacterium]